MTDPISLSRWRRFLRFFYRPRPWFWMTMGVLGGIIIPLMCLVCAYGNGSYFRLSKWQSGKPDQYADLLLQSPSVLPFYPFLIFSMVCCGLVMIGGQRWIDRIWVRFGIYTGVLLATQFHILVFCPADWHVVHLLPSLLLLAVGVLVTFVLLSILMAIMGLLAKTANAIGRVNFVIALVGLFGIRCLVQLLKGEQGNLFPVELAVLFLCCVSLGTIFATTTYSLLAWHVWRRTSDRRLRFTIVAMFGGLTWSGAFLAAWRHAILLAIEDYQKLPLSQPQCYVCTAAAKGHRRLVGGFAVVTDDGEEVVVNRQLQILKAAELAMMTTLPRTHRTVRRVYDHVGPGLASCLAWPILADAAYVLMKPAEWPARVLLGWMGIPRRAIEQLYRRR